MWHIQTTGSRCGPWFPSGAYGSFSYELYLHIDASGSVLCSQLIGASDLFRVVPHSRVVKDQMLSLGVPQSAKEKRDLPCHLNHVAKTIQESVLTLFLVRTFAHISRGNDSRRV
ncbi:Piso0_005482 [Millerozyma farinosa CBS 7064]|uniref:Piso0_005482 protein n=1 Tax=Pichia sorbitophila (strain ATCC MYA-4447 / BCRC 22081 / CBS 7064 / NBRC 10061 / NRRL Y-12695) TaxID=559304 RepID=G8XZ49_PICSO|nr:Piso0_005482 [Millerozyma farinosa CBS 7064]